MKTPRHATLLLAASALVFSACGDDGEDPCAELGRATALAVDDFCADASGCCTCDCWEKGQLVEDAESCTCRDPLPDEMSPGCDGQRRTDAETCLADLACLAGAKEDSVTRFKDACIQDLTGAECEKDSDCVLENQLTCDADGTCQMKT